MTASPARVILQARTESARLPGKVLLPIGGLPLAVLCARRAATTGLPVVLAVPDGPADDALASVAGAHAIAVERGPLDDVLSRFIAAMRGLDDDAVVVRLTGDNPVPDGAFVDFAIASLRASGSDYIGPEFGESQFPHGLSAEAFRAGALRAIDRSARTAHEREHVTTALRARVPDRLSAAAAGVAPAAGRVRCSIDRGTEYVHMRNLFESVADPVNAGWPALLDRLSAGPAPAAFRVPQRMVLGMPAGHMSLGTVQLGIPYGIANRTGQPDPASAADIVNTARMCGVTYFDTARMYGESEQMLGDALAAAGPGGAVTIVTKLPPVPADLDGAAITEWVRQQVARSAEALRRPRLDVVMLHRWKDWDREAGAVWRALRDLRDSGLIGALGASVQDVAEAMSALTDPDVRHLQLPVNLLDWRWRAPEFLRARAARRDLAVHARSALLQGVLAMDPARWPSVDGLRSADVGDALARLAIDCGRASVPDLAFAYVRALPWVDTIVVGAERVDQVIANVDLFSRPPLTAAQAAQVESALPSVPEALLNPALWPATIN